MTKNESRSLVEQPTVLFQLPQGIVYAPESPQSSSSPAPSNQFLKPDSVDSSNLFSAAVMNGSSSSASSASPVAPNSDDQQQQLINNFLMNGQNMQQFFELMSRLGGGESNK